VVLYALVGVFFTSSKTVPLELNALTSVLSGQFSIGSHLLIHRQYFYTWHIEGSLPYRSSFFGALLGALFALLFQTQTIISFAGSLDSGKTISLTKGVMEVMFSGYRSAAGVKSADNLLSKGGMGSMTTTVWLVLSAMLMTDVLAVTDVLQRIVQLMITLTKGTGSLIAATLSNIFLMKVLTGEQYISVVLPGQI